MLVLRVMQVAAVLAGLAVLVAVHPLQHQKGTAPLVPVEQVEQGAETVLQVTQQALRVTLRLAPVQAVAGRVFAMAVLTVFFIQIIVGLV